MPERWQAVADYDYITKFSSQNYYAAANVPKHYGVPRRIKGITIHHWGVRGQKFQNVVNFLCRKGGNTSAHYVAEAMKIACIVDPANAAWHAGNSIGNATTIGIECRPEATDGDYETVAQLIAELWRTYGKVKLYRHRDWKATACPGDWDISRLQRMAEAIYEGGDVKPAGSVKPTAPAKPKPKPAAPKQPTDYANLAVDGKAGTKTISALQIVMRAIKTYTRAVDGRMGKYTVIAVQEWLRSVGEYPASRYVIDGKFGPATVKALQRFLAKRGHLDTRKWLIDGKFGAETIKALQRYLNTQNG